MNNLIVLKCSDSNKTLLKLYYRILLVKSEMKLLFQLSPFTSFHCYGWPLQWSLTSNLQCNAFFNVQYTVKYVYVLQNEMFTKLLFLKLNNCK